VPKLASSDEGGRDHGGVTQKEASSTDACGVLTDETQTQTQIHDSDKDEYAGDNYILSSKGLRQKVSSLPEQEDTLVSLFP
jgi:hypothetical protein